MIDYYETKSQPITRVMVWRAYHKVKVNHGSAGIDRMNWDDLDKNLRSERYKLWNRLSSGSYFPLPVKQVAINVWNQLNQRLLKWVKWEKGLCKMAAVAWLKLRYKDNPGLFHHWKLVHP